MGDQPAERYMDSCPGGQVIGCTYVLAEAAGAAFALTGTVRALPPTDGEEGGEETEFLVRLSILDVETYEEALEVELVYTSDTEESFADAVPNMLRDVVEGWVGQVVDIRAPASEPQTEDQINREVTGRELDELQDELGEVEGSRTAGELTTAPRREERERFKHEEMLTAYDGRPAPWEEMEITSRQYLAWWNSGWDYPSWSRRFEGRKGQVMLRLLGGYGATPTHALYWGRTAFDTQAQPLDSQAVQELRTGGGSHLGVSLGYGITPTVEIELGVAREGGVYEVDVRQQDSSGGLVDRRVESFPQGLLHAWIGARVAPMPTSPLRPTVGAGLGYWLGHDAEDHTEIPLATLPVHPAPHVLSLRLVAGGEFRLTDKLDLILQAPVHLLLAGTEPSVYDEGLGVLTERYEPGGRAVLAAGVQLGAQLRL